jgi:hypothetical protein
MPPMPPKKRTGLHLPVFQKAAPLALTIAASQATTDDDGMFTALGQDVLTRYANAWMKDTRDLELERQYPDLSGSFYDVRADSDYARRWADPDVLVKSLEKALLKAFPAAKLIVWGH